jgi:hypothetical protein
MCTFLSSPTFTKSLASLTFPEQNILRLFFPLDPSTLLFSLFSNNLLLLECGQNTPLLMITSVAHLFNKNTFLITLCLRVTDEEASCNLVTSVTKTHHNFSTNKIKTAASLPMNTGCSYSCKVKYICPYACNESIWGSYDTAPRFIKFDTGNMSGKFHSPPASSQGKVVCVSQNE